MMGTHDTSVTEMILMESRLLEDGEFRLSDVPAGTAMLLGEAAVFNVDDASVPRRMSALTARPPLEQG
jgi:hypothetical protein